jgi:hypothetical protein
VHKHAVRWMIRRNIAALNRGRYQPVLSMFAPDAELAFPGVNSWSGQCTRHECAASPIRGHAVVTDTNPRRS